MSSEYIYVHEMRGAVMRIIDIVGSSGRAETEQDRKRSRWHGRMGWGSCLLRRLSLCGGVFRNGRI